MDYKNTITQLALENALKFKGKANPSALVGSIIKIHPEAKDNMSQLQSQIKEIVEEINKLSIDKQEKELLKLNPNYFQEQEKKQEQNKHIKDELKELDKVNTKKGVIMRFAPSPSGPMHIGHAITGGLTSLYVKKYGGKFILRIEDTNSDNIYLDAYKLLPEDANWIFGNVSEVWIQSDRMQIYYDYLEKLLKLNAIYICTCSQEQFKSFADTSKNCPCRNNLIEENQARWEKMFDKKNGFKEGEAVIRFKSGMQDKNPAMRDFPLARINDSNHPRQGLKYRVWPLMNLCVTVDDIEAGMTHIIRAKEHADNAKRQEKIYQALGIADKFPQTYFLGRYNFEGLEISCTKTKARIKKGDFSGWDDIRVPFLQALRRKGYQPEALLKYTKLTGLSQVDKTIPGEEFFKIINSFNKELIDPKAKRFFMLTDAVKIKIINAKPQKLKLQMHPENSLGLRELDLTDEFLISNNDCKDFQNGEVYRLMDCLNFKKSFNEYSFDSLDYETFKEKGKKIIHFLPTQNNINIEILMNDATTLKGIAEKSITTLKVGEIIQFERFGFCRLDEIKKDGTRVFWFTHK
ncbi:MAG: glutamate--tRNA ligase [Candidatus Woesearchaeota archaeon]